MFLREIFRTQLQTVALYAYEHVHDIEDLYALWIAPLKAFLAHFAEVTLD